MPRPQPPFLALPREALLASSANSPRSSPRSAALAEQGLTQLGTGLEATFLPRRSSRRLWNSSAGFSELNASSQRGHSPRRKAAVFALSGSDRQIPKAAPEWAASSRPHCWPGDAGQLPVRNPATPG